ncbi:MAG TPA: response regulator [Dehalococcoidia bacterium]|nr:response regulator [Dehalococcoidia bacterium]
MFSRRGQKRSAEANVAPNRRHVRVLIVEDSITDAKLEGQALEKYGIREWKSVDSAEEALRELDKEPYNVVLLDYGLPRMNGLSLLERIKQNYPNTRVILVTGARDEQVAVAAMKLGADDYITKDEFLTAGIISSLQNTLRSLEDDRKTRVAATSSLEAGIAEAEALLALDDLPADYGEGISLQDAEDREIELEGLKQLILASDRSRTAEEQKTEDRLVARLVESGASPRDIVRLHHAALRSIRRDATRSATTRAPACAPTMVLAHILQAVIEDAQRTASMASLESAV